MSQQVGAKSDRVHEGVVSVAVELVRKDGENESLTEMFIAPTPIVRALAGFLSQREEGEAFVLKHSRVRFQDVSICCGDSTQAIDAYRCLRHYDLPLDNFRICDELIRDSDGNMSDGSGSSSGEELGWVEDSNFQRFKNWYSTENVRNANPENQFFPNRVH